MDIKERLDSFMQSAHNFAHHVYDGKDHTEHLAKLEGEISAIKAHFPGIGVNQDNSARAMSTGTIPSTGVANSPGITETQPEVLEQPVGEGAVAINTEAPIMPAAAEHPATITDPDTGVVSDLQEDGSYKARDES